ncbi:MAG: formylglycine-generating enzyme family protein [Bacteroidetes bacterium]|nr:formylglycine-generating enzyme family protein [Bacteroidota bacterium]
MNRVNIFFLILFSIAFLFACSDDEPTNTNNGDNKDTTEVDTLDPQIDPDAPFITGIAGNVTQLIMGNGYTIQGKNFGTTRGKVYLANDVVANTGKWTDTTINITTNEKLAPGKMYVVNANGKKGNTFSYTVAPNSMYPTMLLIKGGTFVMGDNSSTIEASKPEHNVTVNSFYMSASEITQKQYKEVIFSSTSFSPDDEDCPANYLRFYDAVAFCNKLSELHKLEPCYTIEDPYGELTYGEALHVNVKCDFSKNGYRLPTEAEWEYAAKAGSNSLWGVPEPVSNYAYYGMSGSSSRPSKVQQKMPNAYGLYDMNGNLAEWCWDWYSNSYYSTNQSNNPKGPSNPSADSTRMVKGGGFRDGLEKLKVASKVELHRIQREIFIGFRVVRNAQ